jgi:hypothetical protein
MLMELIEKEMASRSACGRLLRDAKSMTSSKVFIGVLVAIILRGLRCEVHFMLCVLLIISILIVLFFKQVYNYCNCCTQSLYHLLSSQTPFRRVLNLLHLKDWCASVQHCFREANSCEYLLAKTKFDVHFSLVLVTPDCNFLHALLVLDCKGVSTPRSVC